MRTFIYLVIVVLLALSAPGCTIHFKGENLELDAERQRVYKFDSVTFTKLEKTEIAGPAKLYRIEKIEIFRSKPRDIARIKTRFVRQL